MKKRKHTLDVMFRLETKRTMELFGMDENGSSDFNSFHEIVKNVFLREEIPEKWRHDLDGLILSLDDDKSGTLEVDEVNAWFKIMFKGKIQSRGFKRVREIKKMKTVFDLSQSSSVCNYLIASSAERQLMAFFHQFIISADLYTEPIVELSNEAPREMHVERVDRIVDSLISDVLEQLTNEEGRIYFDDLCRWYIQTNGGWTKLNEDGL